MASPVKETNRLENITPTASRIAKERTIRIGESTQSYADDAFERVRQLSVLGYSRVISNVQRLGRHTQEGLRRAKEGRPLQVLAGLLGAACVTGIAIRIWRSRVS